MTLTELNELVNNADVYEALDTLKDICEVFDGYDATPESDRVAFPSSFDAFDIIFVGQKMIVALRKNLVDRFDTEPDQMGYEW